MAEIGVRIKRDGRKEHHSGLPQSIRRIDRDVERGIIQTPLRALHPVHDASPSSIRRSRAPDRDSRLADQPLQVIHLYSWLLAVGRHPLTLILENESTAVPVVGRPIESAGRKVVKISRFFNCGSTALASSGCDRMR